MGLPVAVDILRSPSVASFLVKKTMMKTPPAPANDRLPLRWIIPAAAMLLAIAATPARAQYNLLHEFAGGDSDGAMPYYTTLTLSSSTLYGMTYNGGYNNNGTVFKINTDGSGFSLVHAFAADNSEGRLPYGSVTLSGSTLYGMTYSGGANSRGTAFKVNTDGSGFGLLRVFSATATDGRYSHNSFTIDGATLYGMTTSGGSDNDGNVFRMNTDGSGFNNLHEFAGAPGDGRRPNGDLLLVGSTLYGTTRFGGGDDYGTVFKVNTDGTGFSLLHEFDGTASDGRDPYGALTLAGSTLYGMTYSGGANDMGAVFKMNTDGTGFIILHHFAGGDSDGRYPSGSLTLSGSTLYGLAYEGGTENNGILFQINSDGTGFTILHEFAGGTDDGSLPTGSLALYGSTLYGMTHAGGDSGKGVIFSYTIPEPSSGLLVLAGLAALSVRRLRTGGRNPR